MERPPEIRNLQFNTWIKERWSTSFQRIEEEGDTIVVQYPDMDAYAKAHDETVMETKLEGYVQGNHGEYSDINIHIRYTVLVRWTFSTIDGVIRMVKEQMSSDFARNYPEFTVTDISNPAKTLKPEILSLKPDKKGYKAKVKVMETDKPEDYETISIPVKRRPIGDKVKVRKSVRKGVKVKGYTAHRRKWEDVEENRALQLRNQNVSYSDIGNVLNRSASSIANKFYHPKTWAVEEWVVKNAVQRARDIRSIAKLHKETKKV